MHALSSEAMQAGAKMFKIQQIASSSNDTIVVVTVEPAGLEDLPSRLLAQTGPELHIQHAS